MHTDWTASCCCWPHPCDHIRLTQWVLLIFIVLVHLRRSHTQLLALIDAAAGSGGDQTVCGGGWAVERRRLAAAGEIAVAERVTLMLDQRRCTMIMLWRVHATVRVTLLAAAESIDEEHDNEAADERQADHAAAAAEVNALLVTVRRVIFVVGVFMVMVM